MGINHSGSDITVTQQFLNRADIIVACNKWLAKLCRKVWADARLGVFAFPTACLIAFWTWV